MEADHSRGLRERPPLHLLAIAGLAAHAVATVLERLEIETRGLGHLRGPASSGYAGWTGTSDAAAPSCFIPATHPDRTRRCSDSDQAFRSEATGGGEILLGTLPGGNDSRAYDVSADGSIVVGTNGGPAAAFIWVEGYGMRSLNEVLAHDYCLDLPDWELRSVNAVSDDGFELWSNVVDGR